MAEPAGGAGTRSPWSRTGSRYARPIGGARLVESLGAGVPGIGARAAPPCTWGRPSAPLLDRAGVRALRHRGTGTLAGAFSFTSPLGACESCRGFGRVMDSDPSSYPRPAAATSRAARSSRGPDQRRPWSAARTSSVLQARRQRTDVPWRAAARRRRVRPRRRAGGSRPGAGRDGVTELVRVARGSHLPHARARVPSRVTAATVCPACHGARVQAEALDYRVAGRTIADVSRCRWRSVAAPSRATLPSARRKRRRPDPSRRSAPGCASWSTWSRLPDTRRSRARSRAARRSASRSRPRSAARSRARSTCSTSLRWVCTLGTPPGSRACCSGSPTPGNAVVVVEHDARAHRVRPIT